MGNLERQSTGIRTAFKTLVSREIYDLDSSLRLGGGYAFLEPSDPADC